MLWSKKDKYTLEPFNTEKELEESILIVQDELFGENIFSLLLQ